MLLGYLVLVSALMDEHLISTHLANDDIVLLSIQTDNTYYHAMALMSMGQNVFYEGDREKGIQYVSKAVDLISEVDRPDADHLTHSSLIMLARLYAEMKDYNNALENTVSPTEIKYLDTLSDEQLFHYINDIIVHERLFLNADFDRQTIMDRFNLSKERVGNAMSRGSQYTKLTEYTQELRLEYSTLLMSNHPDMNIAKIAEDCGFTSYSYYSKCFRKRFGMTPTEFRSSAEQSS